MRSEFLILILIIVLVIFTGLFAFLSAHTQALDQKILVDVSQISQALKIFNDENGFYPYGTGVPQGIDSYLSSWPTPENKCGNITNYAYSQKSSGNDYSLSFCLNGSTNGFSAGIHTLNAEGVN